MPWSCILCTFTNKVDAAQVCEICETKREGAGVVLGPDSGEISLLSYQRDRKPTASSSLVTGTQKKKKTVQSTLFGGTVPRPENSTKSTRTKVQDPAITKKRKIAERSSGISKEEPFKHNKAQPKHIPTINSSSKTSSAISSKRTLLPLSLSGISISKKTCPDSTPISERQKRADQILKNIFGLKELRNLQPAAVECALQRKSQLLCMATGGGKSLCYQLPALALGGTTIVLSPLIALMTDQVQSLRGKGVEAVVISSAEGERRNLEVMERLLGRSLRKQPKAKTNSASSTFENLGPITFVYCTPEQLQTERFRNILAELHQKNQLTMMAVDEAHCLSSWGHDFRPAYRKLDWFRDTFPDVPCLACTATATPKVLQDIRETLRLQGALCHVGSFDRQNIVYEVRYKDGLDNMAHCSGTGIVDNSKRFKVRGAEGDLLEFIARQHSRANKNQVACSGIVYVFKKQDTIDLSTKICQETGISAVAYHGALKATEREEIQKLWMSGEAKIAVATIAFGMGIDLKHVRYVIHWNLSKTVEGFYQESGRAGRDGLPSISLLYYSKSDASRHEYWLRQAKAGKDPKLAASKQSQGLEALRQMVNYCTQPKCRRIFLLNFFGEKHATPKNVCNKTCDYCVNPSRVESAMQAAHSSNEFKFYSRPAPQKVKSDFGDDLGPDENIDESYEGASRWNDDDEGGLLITGQGDRAVNTFKEAENHGGFVHFKSRTIGGKIKSVVADVPMHLRKGMPDPLTQFAIKAQPKHTSANLELDTQQLQSEIEQSRAEHAAKLKELNQKRARRKPPPPPPPPPPPSFSTGKSRR